MNNPRKPQIKRQDDIPANYSPEDVTLLQYEEQTGKEGEEGREGEEDSHVGQDESIHPAVAASNPSSPSPPTPPPAPYQSPAQPLGLRNIGPFHTASVTHETHGIELQVIKEVAQWAARRALLVNKQQVMTVVELGTFAGESALSIIDGIRTTAEILPDDREIIVNLTVVDHFTGVSSDPTQEFIYLYGGSIRSFCEDNLAQLKYIQAFTSHPRLKVNCAIVEADTAISANLFRPDSVDFLFVDADHTHEGATKDMTTWLPKMARDSIMAGHDYSLAFLDCAKAVDDFCDKFLHCRPMVKPGTTVWAAKVR